MIPFITGRGGDAPGIGMIQEQWYTLGVILSEASRKWGLAPRKTSW